MKIVDRETFLSLPAGVLYSKYAPCYFEDLCIKGDTISTESGEMIDWFYQSINDAVACNGSGDMADKLTVAEHGGTSVSMDLDCEGRDGCFHQDQQFAVWEADDIAALLARLARVVPA